MQILRLIDVWPDADFFDILDTNVSTWFPTWDIPWDYDHSTLDFTYFLRWSYAKPVSPMIRCLLELSQTDSLEGTDREWIVQSTYDLFKLKWKKLWATTQFQYNPIHNYDMKEVMDKDTTGSDSMLHGHVVTTAGDRQDNVFGYNDSSEAGTPAGKSIVNNSDTHSGTDTRTLGGSEDWTLTRSGNIGVMSSQSLVSSEREVWLWDYFKQVFSDIDSVLTLNLY